MQPVFRVAHPTILAISFHTVPPTTLDFSELPDREPMEAIDWSINTDAVMAPRSNPIDATTVDIDIPIMALLENSERRHRAICINRIIFRIVPPVPQDASIFNTWLVDRRN